MQVLTTKFDYTVAAVARYVNTDDLAVETLYLLERNPYLNFKSINKK